MTDAPRWRAGRARDRRSTAARDAPAVQPRARDAALAQGAARAWHGCGASESAARLFLALRPQHQTTGSELYNTSNRMTPDGLANLPRDYTGLPRNAPQLGPPLPGDLGRPIANAGAPAPGMPTRGEPNPEQQRIAQEQEAARTSHLFATTNRRTGRADGRSGAGGTPGGRASAAGSSDLTSQDHKLAFLNGNVDRRTVSPDRVEAPASQYVLQAGAVIPAALITGLRSDLPGQVTAQVTEDVYRQPDRANSC